MANASIWPHLSAFLSICLHPSAWTYHTPPLVAYILCEQSLMEGVNPEIVLLHSKTKCTRAKSVFLPLIIDQEENTKVFTVWPVCLKPASLLLSYLTWEPTRQTTRTLLPGNWPWFCNISIKETRNIDFCNHWLKYYFSLQ